MDESAGEMAAGSGRTFDLFVEGESNRLAKTALLDLAEGRAEWSGLFLAASGPWGKTHLLESLARSRLAAGRPVLTAADDWPMADWPADGLLIVDDAQRLAERPDLQRSLIRIFDAPPPRRPAVIVCSGPAPPGRLEGLPGPLISRLSYGPVLTIDRPEYELLLALAVRRGQELGLDLPLEAQADLVRRAEGDPRRLMGLMATVFFIIRRGGLSLDAALARLGPAAEYPEARELRGVEPDEILAGVAAAFGLKVADLTGHSRLRQAAWPRRVAMFMFRELTRLTTTEIGRAFGGRDHSTVIHALKKIQGELRLPSQARLVENIKRAISEAPPQAPEDGPPGAGPSSKNTSFAAEPVL